MENRRGKDDKMSRQVWKEVESRKADKTRIEKAEREERKKRKKETHDKGSKDDRKNNERERE